MILTDLPSALRIYTYVNHKDVAYYFVDEKSYLGLRSFNSKYTNYKCIKYKLFV